MLTGLFTTKAAAKFASGEKKREAAHGRRRGQPGGDAAPRLVEGEGGAGLGPAVDLPAVDDEVVEVEDAELLGLLPRFRGLWVCPVGHQRAEVGREQPAGAVLVVLGDALVEGW